MSARKAEKPTHVQLQNMGHREFLDWLTKDLDSYGGMLSYEAIEEIKRRLTPETLVLGEGMVEIPLTKRGDV